MIIEVDRVDAYEAEPDYSYQVVFNWSAPIEDAVPFYYNMGNPANLKALDDACRTQFGVITGSEYAHNRVCLTADAFQIRAGIDPKKAFANLANKYDRAQSLNKSDLEKIFAASDLYIRDEAKRYKTPNSAEALITAALPLRQFIQDKATALAYVPGSLAWLFVLDADSGLMYQFAVFTK